MDHKSHSGQTDRGQLYRNMNISVRCDVLMAGAEHVDVGLVGLSNCSSMHLATIRRNTERCCLHLQVHTELKCRSIQWKFNGLNLKLT
jgi:hypothetical protein